MIKEQDSALEDEPRRAVYSFHSQDDLTFDALLGGILRWHLLCFVFYRRFWADPAPAG